MKKKLLSLFVLFGITLPVPLYAEEERNPVEPNIYEKEEINIYNNFQDNLIQREELPAEQQYLTFEKPKDTESNVLKDQLFESTVTEKNTITTKADHLNLFSEADNQTKQRSESEQTSQSSSSIITVMVAVVVIVIAAMFFLIIPRLKNTSS
ncbi:type VII secretion protein EssA [Oceanobacillus longus]|uniref:Type VII secretion protein EssA n=1 Tax=Oceanobacillus longus TaxID=930120 RepID=A0ABV8H1V2_9BACI